MFFLNFIFCFNIYFFNKFNYLILIRIKIFFYMYACHFHVNFILIFLLKKVILIFYMYACMIVGW